MGFIVVWHKHICEICLVLEQACTVAIAEKNKENAAKLASISKPFKAKLPSKRIGLAAPFGYRPRYRMIPEAEATPEHMKMSRPSCTLEHSRMTWNTKARRRG